MLYILYGCITPNTASGNRFLSILDGFDELGIKGTVVLINPSDRHYRIQKRFNHIKVLYLWKNWPVARRILDRLYRPLAFRLFKSMLKDGDSVFCYGSPEYVSDLVRIPHINVYHERTESPEVIPLISTKAQKRYLEACKDLTGLFVISTALRDYFVHDGVDERKICIVNMMVDGKRFVNLKKTPGVEKYIAYCGTAFNNKDGVDDLIKAFCLVSQRHSDVKLYIVGKTRFADEGIDNLVLIEELGIKEKVVFTGEVNTNSLPQLLKDATVLALDRPNSIQAQFGFPTKLGEYLMTENPVVVTKVGDIPSFLKDGESALLSEQRNTNEFASKLCWALEHPQEAIIIGKKGRQVAFEEFNYLTESKKIIDFIYGKNTYCR